MIRFSSGAARELEADYRRYERQRPGRGRRFLAEIDFVLSRLSEAADSFPILEPPDIRSAKVERFPYRLVFMRVHDDIFVVAVAHGRRRSGYWKRRVER